MSISGNLETMELAELLQWLSQAQKTGTLEINGTEVRKEIFLKGGRIISSSSSDPREYLGHFLVGEELITEEQLTEAVEAQESKKMLLGKILVEGGALSEDQLNRVLRHKAEESIFDVFTWEKGEFRFHDQDLPDRPMVPIDLDVTGIMMEGARRVDEWRRIRESIPSKHAVPVVVGELEQDESDANTQEINILGLVDDKRSFEEIRNDSHATAFLVGQVLHQQVEKGRMKVVEPRVVEVRVEVPVEAPPVQGTPMQAPATAAPPPQGTPSSYGPPLTSPAPSPDTKPIETGTVSPPAEPAASAGSGMRSGDQLEADNLLTKASEKIAQEDFERALRYLRSAGSTAPDDAEITAAVKAAGNLIRRKIEKTGITPAAVPRLKASMEQLTTLNVSSQEGFILTRIDGAYSIASILKISPIPELDVLVLFWKLKRDGLVAF